MELAKLSSKGQITIPCEVRRELGLKEGDKVLFLKDGNAYRICNSTILAFAEAQREFAGEAERLGLNNEDDVTEMIRKMRQGK